MGDSVSVSGTLFSQGKSLSNKKVTILADGVSCGEALSSNKGAFKYELSVPFKYSPLITLRALYTPAGADIDSYLPGASAPVGLAVEFYNTEISINAPPEVYLGLPFTLSGEAGWDGAQSPASRVLKVFLDSDLISAVNVSTGPFQIEAAIAVGMPLGGHTIRAEIYPDGRYAGASDEEPVNVVRTPPQVTLDAPGFVVLPGHVAISGTVTSDLPIKGAEVRVDFVGESVTTVVGDNGRFNTSISVGMKWGLLGFYDLTVSVFPSEPWNADVAVKARVFALGIANLLTIALSLAIAVTLGSMAYTRKRRRKRALQNKRGLPYAPAARGGPAPVEAVKPRSDIVGNKSSVLRAYAVAVKAIERRGLGVLEPHMTMREFLSAVSPALRSAQDSFSKLTSLSERALYSGHEIEDAEAAAAQQLAANVSEVIRRGLS